MIAGFFMVCIARVCQNQRDYYVSEVLIRIGEPVGHSPVMLSKPKLQYTNPFCTDSESQRTLLRDRQGETRTADALPLAGLVGFRRAVSRQLSVSQRFFVMGKSQKTDRDELGGRTTCRSPSQPPGLVETSQFCERSRSSGSRTAHQFSAVTESSKGRILRRQTAYAGNSTVWENSLNRGSLRETLP